MKVLKKPLSVLLAFLLVFGFIVPVTRIEAEGLELSEEEGELPERERLQIAAVREDLFTAQQTVAEVEPPDERYKDLIKQFNEATEKLNKEIQDYESQAKARAAQSKQGGVTEGSIYDLTTIPIRVELAIRVARAIAFGTTELSNKVIAAHIKLGEYVTTGILYILNPFASEGQIREYIDRFEALQEELLAYPDLTPEDIATIYKKAAFRRTIREARKVYRDAKKRGMGLLAASLKQEIDASVSMSWRTNVTCGEIDEQEARLIKAMEKITGPKVRVEEIQFMEGEAGALYIDQKAEIHPVTLPAEAPIKETFMYSDNAYIARVSGNTITPLKTGTVDIICVSKDNATKARFSLTILKRGEAAELPLLSPSGENTEYLGDDGSKPSDPSVPDWDDKREVTEIGFAGQTTAVVVGESFDLAKKTLIFPKNAIDKTLRFESLTPGLAEVSEEGVVTALKAGKATVRVTAASGVSKDYTFTVEGPKVTSTYAITDIRVSDRKAGIFTITATASENGKPYSGPATITVTSGERSLTKSFYLNDGTGSIKFNGFQFGVWRKDFNGTLTIQDQTRDFEFRFN